MHRASPLAREATFAAGAAGVLAALLAWLGPPGIDLAAHAYQRAIFLQHGFSLWNNFWYAGRYSFITYSVLYYPLAALLGIRLLAVATIATAALAFAVVIGREWGPTARWSSRTFAVVWAGIVLSAAFPFALGIALALLALWAIQAHRRWRFTLLAALTLAASPLAFLLLALLLGGIALERRTAPARLLVPAAVIAAAGAVELLLWRAFPDNGRYPFSLKELAAASTFCALGAALTWGVERARILSFVFVVYWAACLAVYFVPSAVGENIARVRYAAIPVAVLALSLRAWRPRVVCLGAFALAAMWNVSPLATNYARASADPAHSAAYWSEVVTYLHRHLSPSYRVEAVDTTGHWAAVYLPRAGIPLARGWFRQDDFPQNRILYSPLGPRVYQSWLRRLGVGYVVVTGGQPDYSSRGEAALLASGRSGLIPVLYSPNATVYRVPKPRALVSGPARVLSLSQTRLSLVLSRGGTYRIAFRFSPYWHPSAGCVSKRPDGMMSLVAPRGGLLTLQFGVGVEGALRELRGHHSISCADVF